MSYRFHLSRYDKSLLDELRDFSISEADLAKGDTGLYFLPDMLSEANESADFLPGKLSILTQVGTPLFHDTRIQSFFEHYRPVIINEEDFGKIIDAYAAQIRNYYEDLQKHPERWAAEIADKVDTWTGQYVSAYNLNPNVNRLVNSYDCEYQIWDLIRMYQDTDWSKHTIVLYGW